MSASTDHVLDALRAAGEPTRLRLLALLRDADLSVGELVQILDQSQPRLSHHLKTLTVSGLVERLPEGAWVFYRAATKGASKRLLDSVFSELDLNSGEFQADKTALRDVRQSRVSSAEAYFSGIAEEWDHIRSLHFSNASIEAAVSQLAGPGPFRRVIDLGTGTGRMLTLIGDRAEDLEGLDLSHPMLTVARANLNQAGLTNARVRKGDVCKTPFDSNSADLVLIHQLLHYIDEPAQVIGEASRILSSDGRILIVDFAPHTLEYLRDKHGHHRLGIRPDDMTTWAAQAGLHLDPVHTFEAPSTLDQGLDVHIWLARPSDAVNIEKEAAA